VLPVKVCVSICLAVPKHERRAVRERRRNVPELHPALGAPPHELDIVGVQMLAA
jgi:hypothetical protein